MSNFVSETYIQQILQAVDIIDIIGNYVALKPKGKEMVGLCPFHDDSKPSFNVNRAKQIFKCFACGAGGNAITFLMRRERLSFPEAIAILAERTGIELPKEPRQGQGVSVDRRVLEQINRWAARFFRGVYEDESVGAKAREYVAGRDIEDGVSRRFGLGYAPQGWDNLRKAAANDGIAAAELVQVGLLVAKEDGHYYDRFRDRLIFPVIDAMGRIIAFGGRTLGDDPAKYINSPESALFEKSRSLYGIHAAKDVIVKQRVAAVVEGYTDCIMAHQFGVSNVIATLGTALTVDHARVLSRYADKVVLVFDSDEAGRKAADRAVDIFFAQQMEVGIVALPEGLDPCDFLLGRGREAFVELLDSATDALEYKWQLLQSNLEQAETIKGSSRAVEEFLGTVAKACGQGHLDSITEGFMVNRVAGLLGRSAREVHREIARLKGQFNARVPRGAGQKAAVGLLKDAAKDGYEKAQQEILEILLNCPEFFAQAREVLSGPDDFADGVLAHVAKLIWDSHERGGSGTIGEVLATIEDVELGSIVTEMAQRGRQRGNYDNTFSGALETLRQGRDDLNRQRVREAVSNAAEQYGQDAEAAMLLEIQAGYKPNARRPGAR